MGARERRELFVKRADSSTLAVTLEAEVGRRAHLVPKHWYEHDIPTRVDADAPDLARAVYVRVISAMTSCSK